MLEEFAAAERAVAELSAEPSGHIRVTTPLDIGDRLTPLLTEFLARRPLVELQVVMTQREVNIVDEGFDCAIGAGALPDSSLVARKLLGGPRLHLFASPDDLARAGAARQPSPAPSGDAVGSGGLGSSGNDAHPGRRGGGAGRDQLNHGAHGQRLGGPRRLAWDGRQRGQRQVAPPVRVDPHRA